MRSTRFIVSILIAASSLAACASGNSAIAPISGALPPSGVAVQKQLPPFLRLRHTPPRPPKRTHAVTAAMRARALKAGWQELPHMAPFTNGAGTELQLTDGSILVQDFCTSNWYRLVPDNTGSYLNGTWLKTGSMASNYGPLYFASAVLADGKVIVNGGEYNVSNGCNGGVETNLGAIYDPVADKWTSVTGPSGWSEIGDAQSAVLSNGTYMLGNCCLSSQALLDEAKLTWTMIGTGKNDANSEEGWTLLRNDDVLTADVFSAPNSELYNPTKNTWATAGTVPVNLTQEDEIGPQTMLMNDNVVVAGANGLSAIYDAKTGKWRQGPNLPTVTSGQLDAADAPSAVLPNDKFIIALSPGVYSTPASFAIYNRKKFKVVPGPADAVNDSSYNIRLLVLPNGQVLEDDGSSDVEIYSGGSKPSMGVEPQITSVPASLSPGKTYTVSGKRFNGFSQSNFYGDDVQQATNYPLVRITNTSTGNVVYCRTHDHSYMGIGSTKTVSTSFDVPSTIGTGASTLVVVANGIASAPASVTIP